MKPKSLYPTGEQLSHEWAMVAWTDDELDEYDIVQEHIYDCLICLKYTLTTEQLKDTKKNIRARIKELKATK